MQRVSLFLLPSKSKRGYLKNPIFMQWKNNYMVDPKTMDLKVPVKNSAKTA